jgi:DNA-binding IclR family transcriptional regulator
LAAGGQVAGALALVAPSARLGETQRLCYIPFVREAARRASSELGYAGGTAGLAATFAEEVAG